VGAAEVAVGVAAGAGAGAAGVAGVAASGAAGAASAGASAGGAGDSAADWVSGSVGAGPVDGSVTFHLIGGDGTDPDRRRRGAAGRSGEV
jgi:hypothetical protein